MDMKHKKVAYYPGCALEGTGHSYNRSTKAVGKALGLELEEVKNWNCCGGGDFEGRFMPVHVGDYSKKWKSGNRQIWIG